jgi:hypothetical protein
MIENIDDEWNDFISKKNHELISKYEDDDVLDDLSLNDENENNNFYNNTDVPDPSILYISTKSKIAWLTNTVDLGIFWKINVIPYSTPVNGVIKKQIKIVSTSLEDLENIQKDLNKELYYDVNIIKHINNPNGRVKFKDIRKITIGLSKKDIMSCRLKKKQAFYNCFAMIIRLKIDNTFKEFHIKVFNTGKLEIPGVQNDETFNKVLSYIIDILQPFYSSKLSYEDEKNTVLINSNFNCGFYINREELFDILINKYNIQAIYDSCSYPGIQCKFYYNNQVGAQFGVQTGLNTKMDNNYMLTNKNKKKTKNKDKIKDKNITEVSFMIFRTGSVLIVGMCDENVLYDIYTFLKEMLKNEFVQICQKIIPRCDMVKKDKKKRLRKKTINIE